MNNNSYLNICFINLDLYIHVLNIIYFSGVSICSSPNLDTFGVKFDSKLTFGDHVRGIVSRVSQRIGILRLVKLVFVNTSVLLRCYYAFVLPILEYSSPV